ncbi:MAG: VOC family protein [Nitriliruptorales bacterium]
MCSPSAIADQPPVCASVGAANVVVNHSRTGAEKRSRTIGGRYRDPETSTPPQLRSTTPLPGQLLNEEPPTNGEILLQQAHLDFDVDDLDAGEEQVLALGARKADVQPGKSFRVFLDPAGRPFCLVGPD